MMSIEQRDRVEAQINVSLIEREHLIDYIRDLDVQRKVADPLESDYLAEVIHALRMRLNRLEVTIAKGSEELNSDKSERYRLHLVH